MEKYRQADEETGSRFSKAAEPFSKDGVSRREFLEVASAGVVVGALHAAFPPGNAGGEVKNGIPYRELGRTGEKVSLVGIGGYHLGKQSDPTESVAIIRKALDEGINFLDNCWDYNAGESEIRMGKALREGYRDKAFLMTKIDGRTKSSATSRIEESLRRLQTDHIDLLQFHEVIRDTDPDRVFSAGGALEAVLEAKKAGTVRFIGFTGHKSPEIHLRMLATAAEHHFSFDTVQMPLNPFDPGFRSFQKTVLPEVNRRAWRRSA